MASRSRVVPPGSSRDRARLAPGKIFLWDFRHDADIPVRDFRDLVLDRGSEKDGCFRPRELVVGFEPGREGRGGFPERFVEGTTQAHGHQAVVVLDARRAEPLLALDVYG